MRDFKIVNRITNITDNLNRYFTEISRYPILTPDEEARLAIKSREGDAKSKEIILKSNLRFVVSVAKAYESPKANLEDLISEGNKGLVEAIETFDPSTGFKFISYAVWHIRKNILMYLNNHSRSIRIPTNINHEMRRYQLLEDEFTSYNGREPSLEEMIEIIKDPENGIKISNSTIETIKNNPVSIPLESHGSNNPDEDIFSPINFIESSENSDSIVIDEDFKNIVLQVLSELKPIEKEVIMLRYGLGEEKEPMEFRAIGEKMGRTPEWARIIAKKAEKRFKVIARRKKISGIFG
jgi:RNA polymerase primary sigma factor